MSKRWMLFSASLFFFIQFLIFTYLVHKDLFTVIDFNSMVILQDHVNRRFDKIFSFLSDFGKFEIMTIVLVCLVLIARKFLGAIVTISMYVGLHIVELFGKFFVNHPPPAEFMLRTERIIQFPQFHVRSEFSYPSGHAGRAIFITAIALLLIWRSKRISIFIKIFLTVLLGGYDVAMLFSRVVLGEHWFSDVIGGSLLGIALACFAGIFFFPKTKKIHTPNNLKF